MNLLNRLGIKTNLPPLGGSYTYTINISEYRCCRCMHTWCSIIRKNYYPIRCAKCRSPYWHTPKGILKRGRPKKNANLQNL